MAKTNKNGENSISKSSTSQTCKTPVGVHGLRLKRFEEVVAKLLEASIEPEFVLLPQPPSLSKGDTNNADGYDAEDWLFSKLPQSARVVGNHPHPKRAKNKEGQLLSMLRGILSLVPPSSASPSTQSKRPTTIVDFGGGSGHLGIPLALLLPDCKIIVVDFNERSISLLHEKAQKVIQEVESEADEHRQLLYSKCVSNFSETDRIPSQLDLARCGKQKGTLGNLFTFCGPVEQFVGEPLDLALALHLCGEATDVGLRTAIRERAAAIVVAPCCVGKLSGNAFNPDVFHATGQNNATISYPQSQTFQKILSENQPGYKIQQDWNALAKAADYSDETEFRKARNATRRIAKALLETDRRLYLQGVGYTTALAKMDPLEVTPKNDILLAWRPESFGESKNAELKSVFGTIDKDCENDIGVTKAHLLSSHDKSIPPSPEESSSNNNKKRKQPATATTTTDRNDWTHEEEAEIETQITAFLDSTPDQILVFPTRMGGRKRKLIHFVAERLNLAHWGQGKKVSEKTVAVAKQRPPKNAPVL